MPDKATDYRLSRLMWEHTFVRYNRAWAPDPENLEFRQFNMRDCTDPMELANMVVNAFSGYRGRVPKEVFLMAEVETGTGTESVIFLFDDFIRLVVGYIYYFDEPISYWVTDGSTVVLTFYRGDILYWKQVCR